MHSQASVTSGQIKVATDKGYLRLQFSSALSRQLFGKRQFFKSLGRQDTQQNREWAERIAGRIQADLDHPDCEKLFDPSLSKYFDVKINNIVLHPLTNNALKLQDIWLEFVDYKRKSGKISETTYQTRYNRTFANWLKPYTGECLSYALAEKILFDLLDSGVNKANLKKLISALKEACDRAVNRGNINRNFFANLGENLKSPRRSKQHGQLTVRRRTAHPCPLIEEEDYRAYSIQERDIIIQGFRDSEKASERRIADLIEFLFLTGCRLGEAFALKWNDIKTDWIVFDESYSSETKITKSTKTDTILIFRTRGYKRLNQLINRLRVDYSKKKITYSLP